MCTRKLCCMFAASNPPSVASAGAPVCAVRLLMALFCASHGHVCAAQIRLWCWLRPDLSLFYACVLPMLSTGLLLVVIKAPNSEPYLPASALILFFAGSCLPRHARSRLAWCSLMSLMQSVRPLLRTVPCRLALLACSSCLIHQRMRCVAWCLLPSLLVI